MERSVHIRLSEERFLDGRFGVRIPYEPDEWDHLGKCENCRLSLSLRFPVSATASFTNPTGHKKQHNTIHFPGDRLICLDCASAFAFINGAWVVINSNAQCISTPRSSPSMNTGSNDGGLATITITATAFQQQTPAYGNVELDQNDNNMQFTTPQASCPPSPTLSASPIVMTVKRFKSLSNNTFGCDTSGSDDTVISASPGTGPGMSYTAQYGLLKDLMVCGLETLCGCSGVPGPTHTMACTATRMELRAKFRTESGFDGVHLQESPEEALRWDAMVQEANRKRLDLYIANVARSSHVPRTRRIAGLCQGKYFFPLAVSPSSLKHYIECRMCSSKNDTLLRSPSVRNDVGLGLLGLRLCRDCLCIWPPLEMIGHECLPRVEDAFPTILAGLRCLEVHLWRLCLLWYAGLNLSSCEADVNAHAKLLRRFGGGIRVAAGCSMCFECNGPLVECQCFRFLRKYMSARCALEWVREHYAHTVGDGPLTFCTFPIETIKPAEFANTFNMCNAIRHSGEWMHLINCTSCRYIWNQNMNLHRPSHINFRIILESQNKGRTQARTLEMQDPVFISYIPGCYICGVCGSTGSARDLALAHKDKDHKNERRRLSHNEFLLAIRFLEPNYLEAALCAKEHSKRCMGNCVCLRVDCVCKGPLEVVLRNYSNWH
jgi:hypothetical protein